MSNMLLDHVAVTSRNMTADIEFYSQLGFVVQTRYGDWVMLRDDKGFGVALLNPSGKHPPHYALRVSSREAVERIAKQHDHELLCHRDGSVSVYITDPSGNSLEIVYYPD